MLTSWQLQDAKNRFSKVVEDANRVGPQVITKRGTEVAIVLSYTEYRRMVASRPKLSEFFQQSPLVGVELDLERDKSEIREAFTL